MLNPLPEPVPEFGLSFVCEECPVPQPLSTAEINKINKKPDNLDEIFELTHTFCARSSTPISIDLPR